MWSLTLRLFLLAGFLLQAGAQFAGSSDRTQQELNFLSWATGIRMAYCQATPITDLIDPFKQAIARMINRFCRNPIACRLKKSVTFTKHQIVILDGFPKRENRALNFRFFVVFPHDAVPLDRRIEKPLVTQKILSDIVQSQISELTHGLGWQVLSYERYPRFDPMTTFMNHTIVFILPVSFLCMLFLAYWSSSITSGNLLYSGEGWMVTGSTGGKNAALRRTLEIIEEQKFRFDARRHSLYNASSNDVKGTTALVVYKSNARLQQSAAPPRSLATSSMAPQMAMAQRADLLPSRTADNTETATLMNSRKSSLIKTTKSSSAKNGPNNDSISNHSLVTIPQTVVRTSPQISMPASGGPLPCKESGDFDDVEAAEMMDVVPKIVIVHNQNSMETNDTLTTGNQKMQSHHRCSRRFSAMDDFKRKKSVFGSRLDDATRPKRWKAGSLMFSRFNFKQPKYNKKHF